MIDRSHRPSLHSGVVEQTLETMRGSGNLSNNPLALLFTVRSQLASPESLAGAAAEQVAVFDHLSNVITHHLTLARQRYSLPPPDPTDCTASNLPGDFRPGSQELEGWSVLFYRYVCVSLDMSTGDIAEEVNVAERTIRRRQQRGIERLTRELVRAEQVARREQRRHRLFAALPSPNLPYVVLNENLLDNAQHILSDGDAPHHLLLYGPPGIGKSTVANLLARRLIEAEHFHDLLWLDASSVMPSAQALILEIASRLQLPLDQDALPGQVLRAYLHAHHVLIVLDNAASLLQNESEMERVLATLNDAALIFTSRSNVSANTTLYTLLMPELSREAALDLLANEARRRGYADWEDHFDAIWNTIGGNPSGLTLLLSAVHHIPLTGALRTGGALFTMLRQVWEQLTASQRATWLLPLLFPPNGMSYEQAHEVAGFDDGALLDGALLSLSQAALLDVTHPADNCYQYQHRRAVASFLREYLMGLSITGQETARAFLHDALQRRITQVESDPEPEAALVLLRMMQFLGMPTLARVRLTRALAPQIILADRWSSWLAELTTYFDDDLPSAEQAWLHHMVGVARRRLGEIEIAVTHLQQALNHVSTEDSAGRASILIEMAVVLRYQGKLEAAHQAARNARDLFLKVEDDEEVRRCIHELAQIALVTNDYSRALRWLDRLEEWNARSWGIASQSYLGLDSPAEALEAAIHADNLLLQPDANKGRVWATMGQVLNAMGDHNAAVEYLFSATELLEQTRDMLGYARASNNLAVAYLQQTPAYRTVPPEHIQYLLEHALELHRHTGDMVAAAITQKNLDWLAEMGA